MTNHEDRDFPAGGGPEGAPPGAPRGSEGDDPELTSLDGNLDDPARYPGVEDHPLTFVQLDTDRSDGLPNGPRPTGNPADESLDADFLTIGTDPEVVMDEISRYTDDPDILADFAERQEIAYSSDDLLNRLREHHAKSPDLSGGDIDAAWEDSDQSGEESVGGTTPTPDQDIVEELGEAFGIDYSDEEPLGTADKLEARDRNRWELDPASAEDEADEDPDQ